jgi:hypothetical protein
MTEKPQKTVSRNVTLAISLVSILLAASFVAVVLYYQPLVSDEDNRISDLTAQNQAQASQINFLNSQVSMLQNQTSLDDEEIGSLNSQLTRLQTWLNGNVSLLDSLNVSSSELNTTLTSQLSALARVAIGVNNTSDILTLNSNATTLQSTVWYSTQTINNAADSYTNLGAFTASQAGYLLLNCTSNKPRTYAQIMYSAYGISFNSGEVSVGQNGTAVFPVLPGNVQVIVGNHAANAGAAGVTETVTVTYFY